MKTLIDIAEELKAMSTDLVAVAAEIKTVKCNDEEDAYDRRDKLNIFDNIWRVQPALLRHAIESIKDGDATLEEWLTLLSNEKEHSTLLEAYCATEAQKRDIYDSAKFYVNLLYDEKC